jgi:hypothetical protein
MHLVLAIYLGLMLAHAATGMSALGWSKPLSMITYFTNVPQAVISLFS